MLGAGEPGDVADFQDDHGGENEADIGSAHQQSRLGRDLQQLAQPLFLLADLLVNEIPLCQQQAADPLRVGRHLCHQTVPLSAPSAPVAVAAALEGQSVLGQCGTDPVLQPRALAT